MTTIRQILKLKAPEVWSIGPDATIYEALEIMADKDIGGLPVVDDQGKVVGIFTERHYARNVILKGKSSRDTLVRDLMTTSVLYVRPEQTLADCMALVTEKRVRHLPVLEDEKLIGIVTIGDVVKQVISEQDYTIEQLENYITGAR